MEVNNIIIMSKNLIKKANYDAFDGIKDSALANSAFAIADENGVIVAYKDENGEITMFQNGGKYVAPKHYYAVMSNGTKVDMGGMTSFTPTSTRKSTLASVNLPSSLTSFNLSECTALTNVSADELPLVTNMSECFYGCSSLTNVSFQSLPSVSDMECCFVDCSSITSISLPSLPSVTNMCGCFAGCYSLTSISLPELPNVENMDNCFQSCSSITSISLPELPNVTIIRYCFMDCSSLESVSISSLPKLTMISRCFENCSSLTSISLPSLPNVLGFQNCFKGCTSLENLEIGAINYDLDDIEFWALSDCTKLSVDSLLNVINALPTFTSGFHTCTIGTTNLAKLSSEQIAVATAKNWTLE